MKILLSLINMIFIILLSVLIGISLFGMLGPPTASESIKSDFGDLAFFLTNPTGQWILYLIFFVFLFFLISLFLAQRQAVPDIETEVIKRTEVIEDQLKNALHQIHILTQNFESLKLNPQTVGYSSAVLLTLDERFITIKRELDQVLNDIRDKRDAPNEALITRIQNKIVSLERQIDEWMPPPLTSPSEPLEQASLPSLPLTLLKDNSVEEDKPLEDYEPLPSRRESHKGFFRRKVNTPIQTQSVSEKTELKSDSIDHEAKEEDFKIAELPSRRVSHARWWRKSKIRKEQEKVNSSVEGE